MKHIQEPPFSIQIELTEGCNLACWFCGIAGIRNNGINGVDRISGKNSKPYKFMKAYDARTIAKKIKESEWTSRIEFAMHGEPTLNPWIIEIVTLFRNFLPKNSLMMSSNGGGLLKDTTHKINLLFESGLNTLLLEDYKHANIVDKIKKKYEGPYEFSYYPENKAANPHKRRRPSEKLIVIVEDISEATSGTHSTLNNHTGCAFPLDYENEFARCALPFREMAIRWNGKVALCCNDFRGVYKCGSVLKSDLNKIWQNKYFRAARKSLYNNYRDFKPCFGCNTRSMRVGLLPDKLGKQTLKEPSTKDLAAIKKAISGKPYSKIVKRPWEEK